MFVYVVVSVCQMIVIVQGNMFAVTLYDTVYLYLKLASDILKVTNDGTLIKNGTYMYEQAKNYRTPSGEY